MRDPAVQGVMPFGKGTSHSAGAKCLGPAPYCWRFACTTEVRGTAGLRSSRTDSRRQSGQWRPDHKQNGGLLATLMSTAQALSVKVMVLQPGLTTGKSTNRSSSQWEQGSQSKLRLEPPSSSVCHVVKVVAKETQDAVIASPRPHMPHTRHASPRVRPAADA